MSPLAVETARLVVYNLRCAAGLGAGIWLRQAGGRTPLVSSGAFDGSVALRL